MAAVDLSTSRTWAWCIVVRVCYGWTSINCVHPLQLVYQAYTKSHAQLLNERRLSQTMCAKAWCISREGHSLRCRDLATSVVPQLDRDLDPGVHDESLGLERSKKIHGVARPCYGI